MTTQQKRMTGVLTGTLLALAATIPAYAQTVDEIVALHHKSRGGAENWKTVQTQRMEGTLQASGLHMSAVFFIKRGNLGRQELTIDIPGQGPVAVVNIFDGERAWTINPMTGGNTPQEVVGAEATTMRDQADLDGPLVGYKARGYVVESLGTETIDDRKAYHLKITRDGLPVMHYYLDAETGVELRVSTEAPGTPTVDMSDHRSIDGVLVPHHIRVTQAGQVQAEVSMRSIEFNVPMDDALFTVE